MPVGLLQLETWPQLPPGSTKINLGSYKENSAENWYHAWTLSMLELQDFQAISIPLFLVTAAPSSSSGGQIGVRVVGTAQGALKEAQHK